MSCCLCLLLCHKRQQKCNMHTLVVQIVSAFAFSNKNELIRDDYHKLMRAFRALDPEKKGYIDADTFGSLLSSRGEAFSAAETSTMLGYLSLRTFCGSQPRA